jgi:anti-sigma B factor antagonist
VATRSARPEDAYLCNLQMRGRTAEIALAGELDLAAAPALDAAVDTALGTGEVNRLEVDAGLVSFADSTTLAWLVRSDERVRARGGQLVMSDCSSCVRDLLHVTGLDGHFSVVEARPMR